MNNRSFVDFLRERLPQYGLHVCDHVEALSWGRTGEIFEYAIEKDSPSPLKNFGEWLSKGDHGEAVAVIDVKDLTQVYVVSTDYSKLFTDLIREFEIENQFTWKMKSIEVSELEPNMGNQANIAYPMGMVLFWSICLGVSLSSLALNSSDSVVWVLFGTLGVICNGILILSYAKDVREAYRIRHQRITNDEQA